MAKIKKYEGGGEMQKRKNTMIDLLDRQDGLGKYSPKKNEAVNNKPYKAEKGGSFPDLNKDGKITKADILKGRGVIAKKGAKVKPCMNCGGKMKKK